MSDQAAIECPKCRTAMKPVTSGAVTVDRCLSCGGIWLDAMERERLGKAGAKSVDATSLRHAAAPVRNREPLKCPRDHAQLISMAVLDQPHIVYESCKLCGGSFFDAGEVADASEFTLEERLRVIFGGKLG